MLINLLEEYPVISVEEARMLGKVKGAVLQENHLVAFLCAMDKEWGLRQFQIPVNQAIIGSDAVMIGNSSVTSITSISGHRIENEMNVYTPLGEFVGKVSALHITKDRNLKGIHTGSNYIKSEQIIKIGNIILVDPGINKESSMTYLEKNVELVKEGNTKTLGEIDASMKKEEPVNLEPMAEQAEEVIKSTTVPGLPEEPDDIEQEEMSTIHAKYQYLVGKKLLNTLIIAEKTYPENRSITPELIELAIGHNCILSLIMNAED